MRRERAHTARRSCAASTPSTWRRPRDRWSTRSPWCVTVAESALMPTAVRWLRWSSNAAACIDRRSPCGCPDGSPTTASMSCSPGCDAEPGRQLITVVRKGSRAVQSLPASPDAFVWLRLYQAQLEWAVAAGPDDPLWWTLRRPWRPLSYPAAYRMFQRVNAMIGANWSLHDLRHTAAYRMARDPGMPLTDVQWVLGHAQLTTTQLYLLPVPEDVIASVLAHHRRSAEHAAAPDPGPAPGYRPETMDVLFGRGRS